VLTDAAATTSGATVFRGGIWNVASRIIPQVYVLIVSVAAARFLGPDGLGRQSFIGFVQVSVTMLLSSGLAISLMRYVGEAIGRRGGDAVRGLIVWAWRLQAAGALAGGGAVAAIGIVGADPRGAWLLAGVACGIAIVHTVPSALLIGTQLWRQASIVGIVTGAGAAAATIAVLAVGGGITGMFAVQAVVSAVNLAWTTRIARGALATLGPAVAADLQLRRRVVRFALFETVDILVVLVVWRRSEFFFLDRFSTDAEIALYSISFSALMLLALVPDSIGTVITPALSTWLGAGITDRIRLAFGRTVRLVALLAMPITAATLALGPEALRLVFGEDYEGTGPVLVILVSLFPLYALSTIGSAVVLAFGKIRVPIAVGLVAAVVNIGLDITLIPRYDAVGAALANSGAQLVAGLPVIVYAVRLTGAIRWEAGRLLVGAFASACGGLAAWGVLVAIGGGAGVVLGLLAGCGAFGVCARVLRILPADDASWLDDRAGGWVGGSVGWMFRSCAQSAPGGMPAR